MKSNNFGDRLTLTTNQLTLIKILVENEKVVRIKGIQRNEKITKRFNPDASKSLDNVKSGREMVMY